MGNNCEYVPDITLMSFILFFGTYTCSMALKKFKTSRYFPTTVSISSGRGSLLFLLGRLSHSAGGNALRGSQVALVEVKTWVNQGTSGIT